MNEATVASPPKHPFPKETFSAEVDGMLKPYIEHAFLKHYWMDFSKPLRAISLPNGKNYTTIYQFPLQEYIGKQVEVLISFQMWKDKQCFAFVRIKRT